MNKTHLYWGIILIICIGVFFSLSSTDEAKLGSNYVYDPEHRHIVGEIDIPPVVGDYKYNERFIVAKQFPTSVDNIIYDKMEYNYYLGRDTIYYWIIDKQTGKVWGPIDYNKYDSLAKYLNISVSFVFKNTREQ